MSYKTKLKKIKNFVFDVDGVFTDGSIIFGLVYLSILSLLIWFIAYILYKKGYKIKS